MTSSEGDKWEGVRNLIHKFDFAKEMHTLLQTQTDEEASEEISETEKHRMEAAVIPMKRRSDEKDVQQRSSKGSDKRKCVMFQESSEQTGNKDAQNDSESSPAQKPTQRTMLSVCSVDLSVNRTKQETPRNRLIVLCRNVIAQNKRDADVQFVKPIDTRKEALPKETDEQIESFELDRLQDELQEVTRIVLQMESAMQEAKERLVKLSQLLLNGKKTEEQRNKVRQLQSMRDEHVIEMLNKETQTPISDGMFDEALDPVGNSIVTKPQQEYIDNVERCRVCRPNGTLDEIDSEETNGRKGQTELVFETQAKETRNKDIIHNGTLDEKRVREEHADEKPIVDPTDVRKVIDKKLLENDNFIDTNADQTANVEHDKHRHANDCYEVTVDKTQQEDIHLETALIGTDKQIDELDARSLKLPLKETGKESIEGVSEEADIATNTKDYYTKEDNFEENIARIHEKNLHPKASEDEQNRYEGIMSLDEEKLRNDLTEKSDPVRYQFGTANQVNQYLDFSAAITKELDLKSKRQSEYAAKGWYVDVRKEVYCAEKTLHETNLRTEQTRSRRRLNEDLQKILEEANSEQRLDDEMHTKTKADSTESDLIVSEPEGKVLSVKPCDDSSKAIWGVAMINDELFLLRDSSLSSEVWLVKEESFEFLWKIRGRPMDMTGDSRNRCLYISRCIEPDNEIIVSMHAMNASGRPDGTPQHSWRVSSGRYVTLSITIESNILVTLMESRKLVEYAYNDGEGGVQRVYREIALTTIVNPLHAVKLSSCDTYVVCHGENRDEEHRVCIVNDRGHLLKDFCLRSDSIMKTVSVVPMYLALDKTRSAVIVAENRTGRVVQLNAGDLRVEKVLLTANDGLRGPCRLHWDEASGRIIVADNEHGWRDGKLLIRNVD